MLRSCCLPAVALAVGTMTPTFAQQATTAAPSADAATASGTETAAPTETPAPVATTPQPASAGTTAAPVPTTAEASPAQTGSATAAASPAADATTAAPAASADGAAAPGEVSDRDPLEGLNRAIWGFNQGVDKVVLRPVTVVYRTITPRPLRRGLSRVLANLSEPFSAINAILQGKPDRAVNSLGRFIINTTLGVAGLADRASEMGLKPTPEDFGQTLAVWGVKSSAYLVLPLLGPSTIRDGIGSGVAQYADPYRIALRELSGLTRTQRYGVVAFEAVNARSNLIDAGADALLKSSADPYATARSAYLQRRAAQIADQDDSGASGGSDDAAVNAALKDVDGGSAADVPATPADGSPLPADPAPAAAPSPETPQQDTLTPAAPK